MARRLGWIWPKLSRCPRCRGEQARVTGHRGATQYRRCLEPSCRHDYKVGAVGYHIDRGGDCSAIEEL